MYIKNFTAGLGVSPEEKRSLCQLFIMRPASERLLRESLFCAGQRSLYQLSSKRLEDNWSLTFSV